MQPCSVYVLPYGGSILLQVITRLAAVGRFYTALNGRYSDRHGNSRCSGAGCPPLPKGGKGDMAESGSGFAPDDGALAHADAMPRVLRATLA